MAGIETRVIDRRLGGSFNPTNPHDLMMGLESELNLLFTAIIDQFYSTLIEN